MASPRIETAKAFLAAYSDMSLGSAPHLALRTPECTHSYGPASVGIPMQDNAAFAAQMDGLKHLLASAASTPKEMIESESSNAVTIWTTANFRYHDTVKDDGIPAKDWEYVGEYIFILHFDSTGTKISKVLEFLDSHATATKLRALNARAMENLKKKSESA